MPILSVQGRTLWPIGVPESKSMLSVLLLRPIPTCAHFAFCPKRSIRLPFRIVQSVRSVEGKHWKGIGHTLWRTVLPQTATNLSHHFFIVCACSLAIPMWKLLAKKGQKLPGLSQFHESAHSMYFAFCDDNTIQMNE